MTRTLFRFSTGHEYHHAPQDEKRGDDTAEFEEPLHLVDRAEHEANVVDARVSSNYNAGWEGFVYEVRAADVAIHDLIGVYLPTEPLPVVVLDRAGLEFVAAPVNDKGIFVEKERMDFEHSFCRWMPYNLSKHLICTL